MKIPFRPKRATAVSLPRTAFRLGVVGKRLDGYLNGGIPLPRDTQDHSVDSDKLKAQLETIFTVARQAVATGGKLLHTNLQVPDQITLRIVSSLAPGVDQMAAEWATTANSKSENPVPPQNVVVAWDLILPSPWKTYSQSILDSSETEAEKRGNNVSLQKSDLIKLTQLQELAASVLELDGRIAYNTTSAETVELDSTRPVEWSGARLSAYRSNAWFLSEQSDLLVAVFDPHAPAALAGTAEAVRLAVIKGLPVVAVNLCSPEQVSVLSNHAEFLLWGAGSSVTTTASDWKEKLTATILRTLFPWEPTCSGLSPDEIQKELTALREGLVEAGKSHSWRIRPGLWLDKGIEQLDWITSRFSRPPGSTRKKIDSKAGASEETTPDISDVYRKQFKDLANSNRGWFRFSYLLKSLLALTVIVGLLFYDKTTRQPWSLPIVEILCLLAIYVTVLMCARRHWGEKQFDYRVVSELLRQVVRLKTLHIGLGRMTASLAEADLKTAPAWVFWLPQHLLRSQQILTGSRKIVAPESVNQARKALQLMFEEQIGYHTDKSLQQKRISQSLSRIANLAFVVTVIFGITHVTGVILARSGTNLDLPGWFVAPTLVLLAICAAAAGAAASYKSHSGCERLALRSALLAELFKGLQDRLNSPQLVNCQFVAIAHLAAEAATLIVEEALDWRSLQTHRKVGL